MELKLISQNGNILFKRMEIIAETIASISPKNQEVIEALAKKFSSQAEAIKIDSINGSFGSGVFTIKAKIYENKEDLNKTELKSKKKRDAEKKALEDAKKAEEEAKKVAETKSEEKAE